MTRYEVEQLDTYEDDGTIVRNVEELGEHVVGRRIVSAVEGTAKVVETGYRGPYVHEETGLIIELDTGKRVMLVDTDDCCAYTALESFLLHPESVDHIITGIGTTERYGVWHIYADMGDVMKLEVGWSPGNPFYYVYGFAIYVLPIEGEIVEERGELSRGARLAIEAGE